MRPIRRLLFVPFLLAATVFCTISSPPQTATPASVTDTPATTLTAVQPTVSPLPTTGAIAGSLSYPSEFIPELRVAAFDVNDATKFYYVDTIQNQNSYRIDNVLAGTYHVVAYVLDPAFNNLAGGYSQAVPCGLAYGCNDHSLLPVVVTAGAVTDHIDPQDWYAPAGAFPPWPGP